MRTINFKVEIKNEMNPGEPEHWTFIFLKFQDTLINFDDTLEEKEILVNERNWY